MEGIWAIRTCFGSNYDNTYFYYITPYLYFHSLQFNYLGDPLCNAMDSVIRILPASVTRGLSFHMVCQPYQKYVFFGPCAVRGHRGINKSQPALSKLSRYDEKVIMQFVDLSD